MSLGPHLNLSNRDWLNDKKMPNMARYCEQEELNQTVKFSSSKVKTLSLTYHFVDHIDLWAQHPVCSVELQQSHIEDHSVHTIDDLCII